VPGPKTNEREGTRAVLRNTRTSAYKIREVLDLIRGLPVGEARDILRFSERDAASLALKLLDSAVANAQNNDGLVGDELFVAACFADEGRTYKTFRPRARGRAGRLRKRTAHVTIIVSRLPENRLGVVKAKQERAEADRRARRVAASQKQGGGRRRTRRRGAEGAPVAEDEALTPAEREAQAIVEHEEAIAADEPLVEADEQGDVENEPAAAAAEAEADNPEVEAAEASAAEDAGVVDQQEAAVEQVEPAGSEGTAQPAGSEGTPQQAEPAGSEGTKDEEK
jgi:large subunit ribosomal protein L22